MLPLPLRIRPLIQLQNMLHRASACLGRKYPLGETYLMVKITQKMSKFYIVIVTDLCSTNGVSKNVPVTILCPFHILVRQRSHVYAR